MSAASPGAPVSPGGTLAEATSELAADDPALVGPLLSEAAYQVVLASDLGRLYRSGDPRTLRAAWKPMLADLDAVHRAATRAGSRMALAFLPSVLQVDATLRAATVARSGASLRYRGLSRAELDPGLPNALLGEFARTRGIPQVDLTPVFLAENAAAAREPLYKQNDNHWTPRGNRLAAGSLITFLASLACSD